MLLLLWLRCYCYVGCVQNRSVLSGRPMYRHSTFRPLSQRSGNAGVGVRLALSGIRKMPVSQMPDARCKFFFIGVGSRFHNHPRITRRHRATATLDQASLHRRCSMLVRLKIHRALMILMAYDGRRWSDEDEGLEVGWMCPLLPLLLP